MADQDEPRSPRLNIDPEGEARYPIEKMTRGGRRRASADEVHKTSGRMPPQAMDVEQSVLGAMLLEKEAIARAVEVLPQGSFYDSRHGKIYQAILSLFDRNNPVDLVTVSEELKRRGELDDIGGSYYLTELTAKVATSANVEYHARIIAEKSLLRQFIEVASLLVGKAYEPGFDAFELLDEAEREIFQISDSQLRRSASPIKDIIKRTIERLESLHGREGGVTGVPSGFTRLDGMTGGWQNSDLIIIAARPSMGKCLGRGTKVMMFDGTLKNVEDVALGDVLMGDDSTPRRVLSLARGREQMYWVRQKHGIDYRVNESHILSLKKSRSGDRVPRGTVVDVCVRDYLQKAPKWRNDHKGFKVAVEFPEQALPIEPYMLGLWLGDGKRGASRIYTQDAEVVSYLESYAEARGVSVSVTDADRCPGYTVTAGRNRRRETSLHRALRELGVLDRKHIPHAYLASSRAQRLHLLAGLIDSDGHRNASKHGGTYEITQKDEAIARQIKYLCDTLGFRTSIRAKQAMIRRIGFETTVWRVRFNGNVDEIPVRVDRKKSDAWTDFRDWRVTGITVEKDEVDEYYGFEIDGNRRFLLEDGTVTHNTAMSLSMARNAALHPTNPVPVAYFSLEMSSDQIAQRMLTSEARVDAQAARTGRMSQHDWSNLAQAASKLANASIHIDDTAALSILELRAKARRLKAEHDIGLIIVDYLQLMHGSGMGRSSNREQEIAQISRSLKGLAKELEVPVIALSQLSRAVETRGGDKRPQLSDLRESGCLTGDTLVTRADTGARVPIRELAQAFPQGGFDVWALDPHTYRLRASAASRAFSTGVRPVYRITTALGRAIRATANHKFLTIDGWKRLDALEAGGRLALPRHLPSPEHASRSLDELALLGHLIGDGCTLPRHAIQYTTRERDLAEAVASLAQRVFGDAVAPRVVCEQPRTRASQWYQVYLSSARHHTHGTRSAVAEWLDAWGVWGLRSHQKRVPGAVFEQPGSHIAHFLRHLWATDGCIRRVGGASPRAAIYYASSSARLASDVQALLLRLGINARVAVISQGEKGRDQYHVIVSGRPDVLRFCSEIGAVGAYKQASLAEVRSFAHARTHNTNRDVIPRAAWDLIVRPARMQVGLSERAFQSAIGTAYCGATLYRSAMSRDRAERVAEVLDAPALHALSTSDVYWDRIVSIEPDGEEEVFDLTVPGPHNFEADGIIAHNSIEQDADVVAFLYRAERYGITVDDNGNSTEGIGEVIIGKQRNGPIGTVEVAFVNRYARFENLTTYYAHPDAPDAGGDGYEPPPSAPPQIPPPTGDAPF